jgi:hypothetical protein
MVCREVVQYWGREIDRLQRQGTRAGNVAGLRQYLED